MRYGTLAILIAASATWTASAAGQIPAAPKELGMGGAYVGIARGYESVFLAPANLALRGAPRWSFGFPQVAAGLTLHGPDFADLPDLAQFDELGTSRQDELLSLIPLSGTQGAFALRAPLAALSIGGFGLGVQYSSAGSHSLSRDLAELFLEGYEDGRTDYAVGDTHGQRASYWDFAAAYARQVGPVSVGATAHYYKGGSLVRTRLFEPRVDLEAQDVYVDYVGVHSRGGNGYGIDIGAAYNPTAEITVSGTVSNAFARMNWSEDLVVRQLTLDRELIESADPQRLVDEYEATEAPLDPQASSLLVYEAAQGLFNQAYFPTVARLGVAWQPTATTWVSGDFHRKITEGRLGDDWDQRFAVGVQQALWFFKARAGYAAGNDGGSMFGGGLSIGPLDLGVARYQRSEIDDVRTRGWVATWGLGVAQPF